MNRELKKIVRRQRLGVGLLMHSIVLCEEKGVGVFGEGSGGILTHLCLLVASVSFFIIEDLISILFRDERPPHRAMGVRRGTKTKETGRLSQS